MERNRLRQKYKYKYKFKFKISPILNKFNSSIINYFKYIILNRCFYFTSNHLA